MKSRKEIKQYAKARKKINYWPSVLAAFLVGMAVAVITSLTSSSPATVTTTMQDTGRAINPTTVIAYANLLPSLVIGVVGIFLIGPFLIGQNAFFIQSVHRKMELNESVLPFKEAFIGYWRKLGGFWWCQLFQFLWSLLFIIPGIIKGYSYSMTPYILADCPNVKAKDALKLSMRIMKGKKWSFFVMQLSFIGWDLLSGLTLGILGLFHVIPYKQTAYADFYLEARQDALVNGVITTQELDGLI